MKISRRGFLGISSGALASLSLFPFIKLTPQQTQKLEDKIKLDPDFKLSLMTICDKKDKVLIKFDLKGFGFNPAKMGKTQVNINELSGLGVCAGYAEKYKVYDTKKNIILEGEVGNYDGFASLKLNSQCILEGCEINISNFEIT